MENEITVFSSPEFGDVRTSGTTEVPMFCLADLCKVLGLNQSKVAQRLDKGVLSKYPLETNGGIQELNFVTEDGLYDVILDSRKKSARAFRKWVTSEVLPSIRKNGGYMVERPEETPEEIMARALQVANATLARREERIRLLQAEAEEAQAALEQKDERIALQDVEIRKAAPKVTYYDEVLQSTTTLTATQIANQLGMDATKLNRRLKEAGIIYKQSGQWLLHTPFNQWGLHSMRTQTFTRNDGTTGTSSYTVWTEKGKRFIVALKQHEWNVRKAVNYLKAQRAQADGQKGGEL